MKKQKEKSLRSGVIFYTLVILHLFDWSYNEFTLGYILVIHTYFNMPPILSIFLIPRLYHIGHVIEISEIKTGK